MTRPVRVVSALGCAVLACGPLARGAAAQAHHGGAPARIVADRAAGPYAVSVWAAPDAGMGMLYVVYDARDGAPFEAPTTVRIGVAPLATGGGAIGGGAIGGAEAMYDARPEPVRHGARFVAHVALDGGAGWRVRVVTAGPRGGGEVRGVVRGELAAAGAPGPLALAGYALPFVLVAGLRWRAALARRRAAGLRAAFTT